ncbi:hypothetical protein BV25DRAFT_1800059 [Artomyces pyxidatus]|uniref:Uncharacterized protein n=1 Tax=Artomyces pyxidatus TaxID=48021 RepID=A0ACB8T7P8_9AGAM|nr:hypothetical protein BV25DRAFT_1800059 [Artomyces pyxidatus]
MNASGFCPHLHFVDTSRNRGAHFDDVVKPDISVYHRDESVAPKQRNKLDWPDIELYVVAKDLDEDPFLDPSKDALRALCRFQRADKLARTARQQLVSYAYAHHSTQFRVFTFSVCLLGPSAARLIRWDRSGAVVSERFDWREDPNTLAEFLWRFDHMSGAQRGHDTTVTRATEEETRVALPYLKASGKFPNGVTGPLHKFLVHDDATGKDHYFIAPSPFSSSAVLPGRASAGYIAFDLQKQICVYLKDCWRIDEEEVEQEGRIYRRLHEHKVPHIAVFGCAGDVGTQRTLTQDFADKEWACPTDGLIPYHHYRLILETIGWELETFRSTRQLCMALRDAVIAHSCAYSVAKVFHRDVSAGNILITKEGEGILIDWELSKTIDREDVVQPTWSMGTWQFMSAARLKDPQARRHELPDDLESFLWVLTYDLFRHRPILPSTIELNVKEIFHQQSMCSDGLARGGDGKILFLLGVKLSRRAIEAHYPPPCAALIQDLRSLFLPLYAEDDAEAHQIRLSLQSSTKVIEIFCARLSEDGWPSDDGCTQTVFYKVPNDTGKRRRRVDSDSDDSGEEPLPKIVRLEGETGSS